MAREQRKERRRVSKDDVRNNARESGGGEKYFNLPKGITLWHPPKAASYDLDFLPYEVAIENHPDRRGDKVTPGDLWWKFPYLIHTYIGPTNETIVCPATFGKPCPICEERTLLAKNYEANKKVIRGLNFKKWTAYIIKNPENTEEISVFPFSRFKFGDVLDEELNNVGEEFLAFYDVTEEGKTLKVRFSDDEYTGDDGKGGKFIKATRIDFKDRAAMDEEEILAVVPCLDKCFVVMEYEPLKKLFLQLPDSTSEKGAAAAAKTSAAKPTAPAPKAPAAKPPAKEEGAKFKVGQKVAFTDTKKKAQVGVVTEIDEDEVTIKTADGKLHELDEDEVQPAPEEEKALASDGPAVFKKGDRVIDDEKRIGTVLKYDAVKDEVAVKLDEGGEKITIDAEDLEFYNHDGKGDESGGSDDWVPTVGDKVSWDDGDEEGAITKLHPSEPKAKVKNEAGVAAWVAISELSQVFNKSDIPF